jgi:hypothetical protein
MSKQETLALSAITTAAKDWDKHNLVAGKSMDNLLDLIISQGAKVGFNLAVAKEGRTAIYSPLCEAIREGVALNRGKRFYALYHAKTEDLSSDKGTGQYTNCDTERKDKKNAVQQVGSRLCKVDNALGKRLNGDKKGPDQKKTDDQTFCQERVIAMIKRLEKSDNAPFDVIEALTQLVKLQETLSVKI